MANNCTILFLLRGYNDIDHIAPIIWKASQNDLVCYYYFVDKDYSDDYRIEFVRRSGAKMIYSPPLNSYHKHLRHKIPFHGLRRIVDRLVANLIGTRILITYKINSVVSEWAGPYGREMAEYFLRPAKLLRIPSFSVPHGYHYWTNLVVNETVKSYVDKHDQLPSFENRKIYTAYVVQTQNIRQYYLAHGMPKTTLYVLGSARFSNEWQSINFGICPHSEVKTGQSWRLTILFFIPDWSYFIDREATITLLSRIAQLPNVQLLIKQNTRGTGQLTHSEEDELKSINRNCLIVGDNYHSPDLIDQSDCIINFASSIGIEAILQDKIVCNPRYLTSNSTIFDDSGVVTDTLGLSETIDFLSSLIIGKHNQLDSEKIQNFLIEHVYAGSIDSDVLDNYVNVIAGNLNSTE